MENRELLISDLKKCKKNELIEIAKNYGFGGYSKFNKEELLKWLVEKLSTKNENPIDKRLLNYCNSAVALYGIVSNEMLMTLYNTYEEEKISLLHIEGMAKKLEEEGNEFFCQEGHFIRNNLSENGLWKTVYGLQEKYDFYIPETKEEFLEYGKIDNKSPGKIYNELRAYLRKEKKLSEFYIKAICKLVHDMVEVNQPVVNVLSKIVDIHIGYDYIFRTKKDVDLLNVYIKKIIQNTRLIKYRGHTAIEAGEVKKEDIIGTLRRFYPNDSCPCGSGKKYKVCCGK